MFIIHAVSSAITRGLPGAVNSRVCKADVGVADRLHIQYHSSALGTA